MPPGRGPLVRGVGSVVPGLPGTDGERQTPRGRRPDLRDSCSLLAAPAPRSPRGGRTALPRHTVPGGAGTDPLSMPGPRGTPRGRRRWARNPDRNAPRASMRHPAPAGILPRMGAAEGGNTPDGRLRAAVREDASENGDGAREPRAPVPVPIPTDSVPKRPNPGQERRRHTCAASDCARSGAGYPHAGSRGTVTPIRRLTDVGCRYPRGPRTGSRRVAQESTRTDGAAA